MSAAGDGVPGVPGEKRDKSSGEYLSIPTSHQRGYPEVSVSKVSHFRPGSPGTPTEAWDLWAELRDAGVQVSLVPGTPPTIRARAPIGVLTDTLRARVALHRADLVARLSRYGDLHAMLEDFLERWNERAAVLEFDAGLSRDEAEAVAWAEVSR